MNRANNTILALALMVALCGAASAAELHVGTGQTYSTIQDAVDNATSGDTIIVHAGTYVETVKISKPSLTLRGEDRDVVTVTAADPTGDVFRVDYVDYVNISGFTVTGGGDYGIDIGANADHCNISDNNVSNNENGILLESSNGYTVIRNNIVKSNTEYGINLFCQQDIHRTITGTDISDNDISDNEYGIRMYWSSNNTITCNRVHNNRKYGFYLESGSINNTITCNVVRHNSEYGFYLESGSTKNTISYNNIIENGKHQYGSVYHYQFYNDQSDDVDAISNWWGTNTESQISTSIYDWNDDKGKGNVTYSSRLPNPSPCAVSELHVGSGQAYSTIQDAVDNATSGDTIIVHAGTYVEKVTVDKERLTLKVHDGDEVTVTVTGTNVWWGDVFVVTADYVNISGFTATGSGYWAGIHINEADHCNVSDNTISDNYYGIWLSASAYDNKVTGNDVHDNEYGIKLDGTDDNEITCNRVHNNSEYGIKLDDADGNEITCNRVHDNKYGIKIHSAEDNEITCNVVRHNSECGFYLEGGSINNTIENNTIIENGEYDPATGGWQWNFHNQQSDNVSAENNYWGTADQVVIGASIDGSVDYEPFNTSPCPCAPVPEVPASSAKELHVGTGQTYSTIQDAVNASLPGDTIIVHAGTYEENVMISTPALTLQGEDRDVVTVTAADPTGNVFCVNYVDYVSISGFTVTGSSNCGIRICSGAAHCNISDNNVSNNGNSNNGNGILLEASNGYTVIRNNIVKSNAVNGINLFCQQDAHSTITGNDISDNGHGIHMFLSSNNTITCNWVYNNSECGFYLTGGSINNTIENNTIIENGNYNSATGGWQWNFNNQQSDDVAAENNYWGTANSTVIDASIDGSVDYDPFNAGPCPCAPIPELPTLALCSIGLLALAGYTRMERKKNN